MITVESNVVYFVRNEKTNKYILEHDCFGYMTSGACSSEEQAWRLAGQMCRLAGFDYHDLAVVKM